MLSLSPFKIVIIVVVALVLVGPDKLPGLARQIGGAWKAFRSFSTTIETEVRSTMPDLPSTGDIARLARSPVAFLDSLAKLDIDPLEPDPGVTKPTAEGGLQPDPGAPQSEPEAFGDPTIVGNDVDRDSAGVPENLIIEPLTPTEPPGQPDVPSVRPATQADPGTIDPSLN